MQTLTAPMKSVSMTGAEIGQRLTEGKRLIKGNPLKAAAMLWSAVEAAIRLSLTELGEQTDRPICIVDTPAGLSGQAVAYGVIDPEDREVVLRLVSTSAANTDTLQQAAFITERTLNEMTQ